MKKNGISVVALVITVVVTLILVSVGIIVLDSSVDDATIGGFMNDLKEVEDSFSASLIDKGKSEFYTYAKAEVISMVDEEQKSEFQNELILNGDNEEKNFYLVNLNNIGIKKSSRGERANGENDIYVVSQNSLHAYYLRGVKVNDVFYFSISSKVRK